MNYNALVSLIQQTNPGNSPLLSKLKELAIYRGFRVELENLKKIINEHTDENTLRDTLKTFLADYWHHYKKSPLSYTCIPNHPLTHLCINIAAFIAESTAENPLSLLMPGLNLIPQDEEQLDFPNLNRVPEDAVAWLKITIATHIISDDAMHLVPIKILKTLSTDQKSHQELKMPYEFERAEAVYYLSAQAYLRLANHSDYARAVTNAKKQIDIMDQEDNLLSQLRHLIKLLGYYSAHGGIGEQTDAAGAAYNAIIVFHEYYNKLSKEQHAMIPEELRTEIELLLDLSSQAEKNTDATRQLETCIGTRRERLVLFMTPCEKILSQISLSPEEQGTLTIDAMNAFNDAKTALTHALDDHQYHLANEKIQDNLNLTVDLLNKFEIELAFYSTDDLALFASISPEEITLLLKNQETKANIIRYFISHPDNRMRTDQLFILFVYLTPERIIAFLKEMTTDLVRNKVLCSTKQLIFLLASSLPEKCEAICIGLSEIMHLCIPDLHTFSVMSSYLDQAQLLKVYAALENYLPTLLKTQKDLQMFLNLTPNEKLDTALSKLKKPIMDLMTSVKEIKSTLRCVFDEKAVKFITHLAEKIPTLIQNADDFRYIFYHLQDRTQTGTLLKIGTEIYQKISLETISNLMLKFDDVQHILMFLDKEKRIEIYNHHKEKILSLTNTITDIKQLFFLFENEESNDIFEDFKDKIPVQIKTLDNLLTCFSCLNIEEAKTIYSRLPIDRLIKTDKDIQYLINEADENTCSRICVLLQDPISRLVSDSQLTGFNENKRAQIRSCFYGLTIESTHSIKPSSDKNEPEEKEQQEQEPNKPLLSYQNIPFIYNKKLLVLLAISLTISISLIITASILLSLGVGLSNFYCSLLIGVGIIAALGSMIALYKNTSVPPKNPPATADNRHRFMSCNEQKWTYYSNEDIESYGGPFAYLIHH